MFFESTSTVYPNTHSQLFCTVQWFENSYTAVIEKHSPTKFGGGAISQRGVSNDILSVFSLFVMIFVNFYQSLPFANIYIIIFHKFVAIFALL